MAQGESPAVARRRVRLAVREARAAKGITQSDVAEAMEWSLSKVMRIENGEVTISQNDLRPLLTFLGIRDRGEVEGLVQAAKASKQRRQWWDEPRFRENLTPATLQMIQYEAEATAARYFCLSFIPGRLQTVEYSRAILSFFDGHLSQPVVEARLDARIRRRNQLLSRANPPKILLLLEESVLLREVGGKLAMGEQLSDLSRFIQQGWLSARVAPLTGPTPMLATYDLLYLGEDDDAQAVMYRESDLLDEVVDDAVSIKRHREIWDRFWTSSIDEETSARLISERANELLLAGGS